MSGTITLRKALKDVCEQKTLVVTFRPFRGGGGQCFEERLGANLA